MGYQLWTSPITGYRRRGTRLSELRSVLGAGIVAHSILEPLQSCPADALADEMRSVLSERDFDVAGVKADREDPVHDFIRREDLEGGEVQDHACPLTAEMLVSDSTPLPEVLAYLKDAERAFVLIHNEVRGIITLADLNKPPVRVYLFGLISLVEMHLSFWIRASYDEDEWQSELKKGRIKAAKELLEQRRSRNQEISLLECLQFCDKRDLVISREDLRSQLQIGSKTSSKKLLERAEDLRNRLAHSQLDLVEGSNWKTTISTVQELEALVHTSDQLVEDRASTSAEEQDARMLWASA